MSPYSGRLLNSYQPSDRIFSRIENNKPWWGLEGLYRYGPGLKSIEGASEETRFLLNPLLLVGVAESKIYAIDTPVNIESPPWPAPVSLEISPEENQISTTIKVGGFIEHLNKLKIKKKMLDLVAYNAGDLGFNYMQILQTQGVNIKADRKIELIEYIHTGQSCGYPGGCNNTSPYIPAMQFELVSVPAVLKLDMFRNSSDQEALHYFINLVN